MSPPPADWLAWPKGSASGTRNQATTAPQPLAVPQPKASDAAAMMPAAAGRVALVGIDDHERHQGGSHVDAQQDTPNDHVRRNTPNRAQLRGCAPNRSRQLVRK